MTLYRGFEVVPVAGGFTWTDDRNFTHYHEGITKTPYATEEKAMDDIDTYKRQQREAKQES